MCSPPIILSAQSRGYCVDLEYSPGKRLASFRESLSLSQRAFAASLGVAQGVIAFIETDKRTPSKDVLLSLSATYGISGDWLLYGHGDMLLPHAPGFGGGATGPRINPPDYGKPMHGIALIDGIEYARIRRLALDVSAGSGLGPAEEGVDDAMLLPRDWIMRQRLSQDLTVMVRVKGDSMAPAIPDGAFILVNVPEKVNPRPGIYAMTLNGEALVKRLTITSTGGDGRPTSILLVSDNPAYPPRAIAGDQLADFRVVGRVRGVFAFL